MASAVNPHRMRDSLMAAISGRLRCAGIATKAVARRVAADPRAVENWRDGTAAPRAEHLLALMASDPAIEAEVIRLVREARA